MFTAKVAVVLECITWMQVFLVSACHFKSIFWCLGEPFSEREQVIIAN